jgi:hypothetical protein
MVYRSLGGVPRWKSFGFGIIKLSVTKIIKLFFSFSPKRFLKVSLWWYIACDF